MRTHVHNEYIMKHVNTKSLLLFGTESTERRSEDVKKKKSEKTTFASVPSTQYVFATETKTIIMNRNLVDVRLRDRIAIT